MSDKPPRSLRLLRDHAGEVIKACEGSTAWAPYLNLLRDLLDPRPRTVKIKEAVLGVVGALPLNHDRREIAGIIERRLEHALPRLPLAEVPSLPTIRKIIDEEMKRNLPPKFHRATASPAYDASLPST